MEGSGYYDHASSVSILVLLALLLLLWFKPLRVARYARIAGTPVAGAKWRFEPALITRYRFISGGWAVARDGWHKVDRQMCLVACYI